MTASSSQAAPSARRRVLLSRDTLVGLLVVLLAMAVCAGLGRWQYGRFEDRRDQARIVEANYDAEPVALDQVLDDPAAGLGPADDWTPVQLRGQYCTDRACELYVRNRTQGSQVGFWQLVPFEADDGTVLLVVRGWVTAHDQDSAPADPPSVPEGQRTITVRLRPAEPPLERRGNPRGQVHSVAPEHIASVLPVEQFGDLDADLVTGAYGSLVAEDPPADKPTALEPPDTSLGPHLSYAFQWWIFALFFPAALVYRTHRLIQEESDDDGTPSRAAREPRARRRSRDEEEEDALLEHPQH